MPAIWIFLYIFGFVLALFSFYIIRLDKKQREKEEK